MKTGPVHKRGNRQHGSIQSLNRARLMFHMTLVLGGYASKEETMNDGLKGEH